MIAREMAAWGEDQLFGGKLKEKYQLCMSSPNLITMTKIVNQTLIIKLIFYNNKLKKKVKTFGTISVNLSDLAIFFFFCQRMV